MLAHDHPPSARWLASAAEVVPAHRDHRLGTYTLSHMRDRGRTYMYDGSASCMATQNVGLAERYQTHISSIRTAQKVGSGKVSYIHRAAAKHPGKTMMHTNFAVNLPGIPLRKSLLLFALRIMIKHGIEAVRHEWLDYYQNERSWWAGPLPSNGTSHSPATEGVAGMSSLTADENRKRRSAHDLEWRHSLFPERQRLMQLRHCAMAQGRRDRWITIERNGKNTSRRGLRRRSSIAAGIPVCCFKKLAAFDAQGRLWEPTVTSSPANAGEELCRKIVSAEPDPYGKNQK